jgi:type IV secretory pathway TrbD component
VVRAEEALIVIFVLVLWVAALSLFFIRWGKIRMLEPYQPKFQQQHRQSNAIVEPNLVQVKIHCPSSLPLARGSGLAPN